jgi:cell division protein FtsA
MSSQIITAIDIGTSKITAIISKISEKESEPRIMGFVSVDSRGVRKGQIVDINQVTDVIEKCIEKVERMAATKVETAFVSVGGPHISSLNSHGVVAVSQPEVEITNDDIVRAIEAAKAISISSTREVIEVIPREYIVDGQNGIKNPLGMTGVRLEVNTHIITASLTNLRNVERSLSDLGIEKVAYVFSGLASSLASLSETEQELGVVMVDIGGGKTDICIYVDGALSYSSSISIGARHITNDIAVGLRISLDSAEKIKLFLMKKGDHKKKIGPVAGGFTKKDEVDIKELNLVEGITSISSKTVIDGIIRPRLEEIFEKVFEEIQKSNFLTMIPSGLVITGGGALTVGTIETARRVTGLSARVAIPQGVVGLVDEVLFPQFATVVGTVLYGKEYLSKDEKNSLKDFRSIFRDFSFKGSFKKISDLFKSFLP